MTVSVRAILAYSQLASWNHEDWKDVQPRSGMEVRSECCRITTCILEPQRLERPTASFRHRQVQQMPPNGREFSHWLDCASQCVKI